MAALLNGDILKALCCNPTVVYTAAMVVWWLVWKAIRRVSGRKIKFLRPGIWMLIAGVVLFFGFAVVRNVMVYSYGYDYLGDLL